MTLHPDPTLERSFLDGIDPESDTDQGSKSTLGYGPEQSHEYDVVLLAVGLPCEALGKVNQGRNEKRPDGLQLRRF
jgi:hypothetical protein